MQRGQRGQRRLRKLRRDRDQVSNTNDLATRSADLLRSPVSAFLWWCLPLALGVLAQPLGLPYRATASVWTLSFAWMATGCFLNARRCHRIHCLISGPAFLAGAVGAGMLAMGAFGTNSHALSYVISSTFAVVMASFVPEIFWRKYF